MPKNFQQVTAFSPENVEVTGMWIAEQRLLNRSCGRTVPTRRAMIDMLDALDRKRGKAPQVVRVERVVVHKGGQAIVGNVKGGDALPAADAWSTRTSGIGRGQTGITLDELGGRQPEQVDKEGV
jgi:hypothetical protein